MMLSIAKRCFKTPSVGNTFRLFSSSKVSPPKINTPANGTTKTKNNHAATFQPSSSTEPKVTGIWAALQEDQYMKETESSENALTPDTLDNDDTSCSM